MAKPQAVQADNVVPIKIAVLSKGETVYRDVEGIACGAWAAHEDAYGHDYRVTFLRFGLAVPYDFDTMAGAEAAAKEIDALRPNWDDLKGDEMKPLYGKTILKICSERSGMATNGPKGPMVPIADPARVAAE